MKRLTAIGLIALAAATTSGCSSWSKSEYRCPPEKLGTGSCVSMETVYQQALLKTGASSATGSVLNETESYQGAGATKNPFATGMTPYNEVARVGRPVYEPGHVYRPWVAPTRDANGHLESDKYKYFATEPKWGYGSMAPSKKDSLFKPARPGEYGFNPVEEKAVVQAGKAAVVVGGSGNPQPNPSAGNYQMAPGVKQVNGITQPYTRIAE